MMSMGLPFLRAMQKKGALLNVAAAKKQFASEKVPGGSLISTILPYLPLAVSMEKAKIIYSLS
jgi:hypothetical protein